MNAGCAVRPARIILSSNLNLLSSIKNLIGNIGLVVLLNLLIKPVWLLVENKVQDQVGHAAFGTYMALFSFAYISGVAVDLGLNQFTSRHLAAAGPAAETFLPVLFPMKWAVTLFYPVLVVLGGWLLGYRDQELYFLLVIAVGYALSHFLAFLRAILQGRHLFQADAWASVSERLLQLLLVAVLLGAGLETFIYSRTGAVLLAFAGGLLVVRKYLGPLRYHVSWRQVRQVVRGSFPFALILLFYGLNEKIDMVMLERLSSKKETGIYAAAYRWVDAVMMYLWTVLPLFFAKFAASTDRDAQGQLVRLAQVLVGVPIIFVAVFVFYYGPLLFWQFENSSAAEISRMQANAGVLFAHVLVQGFFALYSTLLTASHYEKQVSGLVMASVILNVMLNSIFIPHYGSLAAACNTLVCSVLVSAGYLYLVKVKAKVPIPIDLLLRLFAAAGLLAGVFFLLQYLPLAWYWIMGLAGLAYIGILWGLRLITRKDLNHFYRTP
jgi:O-antigen/teichoic acid export membrane protein